MVKIDPNVTTFLMSPVRKTFSSLSVSISFCVREGGLWWMEMENPA